MIYKDLVNSLINWFEPKVGEVTFGDEGQVDVTSITDFPLVHIQPVGTDAKSGYALFTFDIYILNTKESLEDPIDVLDAMSEIAVDFASFYYSGDSAINDMPSADIVYDQFGNRLYGFKFTNIQFLVKTVVPC